MTIKTIKSPLLSVLILFSVSSQSQTILYEDFDNCTVPANWNSSSNGQGWEIGTTTALSGGNFNIPAKGSCVAVVNDSDILDNNAYNDYLVTPMFDIVGVTALNFEFDAYTPSSSCFLNIEYSKDSTNWSIGWSGTYQLATAGWEKIEFNAGQQFFTGGTERWFRLAYKDYNSNTQGVAVDNFHVFVPDLNDLKLVAVGRNEWSLLNDEQAIEGRLFNNGLNTISSYDLNWQLDNGPVNSLNAVYNLAPTYTTYFEELDAFMLSSVGSHDLKVWVSNPNGSSDTHPENDTIYMTTNGANWLPEKRVLLEKFTHTECSPCVNGDLNLDIMLDDHPFVTGVSIHAAGTDPYTIPDGNVLDETYIIAHPSFMADRKLLYKNIGWFGYDIDMYLGETEDLDFAKADVQAAEVEIENVSFDSGSRELQFDVVATYYGDYTSEMGINAYILEDTVIGYQVAAPDPNNYAHNHVLREMLGGTWGNNFNMSDVNTSDNTYRETFNYTIPPGYNEDNITILGYVQKQNLDVHQRDVINCTPAYHIDEAITLSTDISEFDRLNIYPNPANDVVLIDIPSDAADQLSLRIVDLSGRMVLNEMIYSKNQIKVDVSDFTNGVYMVSLTDALGNSYNQKLIIK